MTGGRLITIEPIGGLGNQLFIYGLGLANSRRLGVDLVADLTFINQDKKRNLELSSFRNSLSPHQPPPPPKMRWAYQAHRHISNLVGDKGRFRTLHYELKPEFDSRFLEVPDGTRLRGYFQSWMYVESVSSKLRTEIYDIKNPTPEFMRAKEELSNLGPWTAVHFRRGDFDSLEGMTLPLHYYERALTHLSRESQLFPIVVFSDDIPLIIDLPIWNKYEPAIFFPSDFVKSPLENMLLMSTASSLVIANSTFSWWAAYIGENPRRLVIHPEPWGDARQNNKNLCLPNWIGISR